MPEFAAFAHWTGVFAITVGIIGLAISIVALLRGWPHA